MLPGRLLPQWQEQDIPSVAMRLNKTLPLFPYLLAVLSHVWAWNIGLRFFMYGKTYNRAKGTPSSGSGDHWAGGLSGAQGWWSQNLGLRLRR